MRSPKPLDLPPASTPPVPLPADWLDYLPRSSPPSLEHVESKSQTESGEHLRIEGYGNPDFACQPIDRQESCFRHSCWSATRLKVWHALKRIGARHRRLEAFANCGSALWLQKSAAGDAVRLTCNACHDRVCAPCGAAKGRIISANIERLIRSERTRFVTLTLRASQTPLNDQIDRIFRDFRELRRRKWWIRNITGGAAFLEVKIGQRSGLWHVHLHLIVCGHYLPQRELSREWHAVTGDSSIVDVRKIDDAEGRARYVTKYVTKPADASVFADPARLDEFLLAMRGRRLCTTFGKWRGVKLAEAPKDDSVWVTVGSIVTLTMRARDGDVEALRWLEAACRRYPALLNIQIGPAP